MLKLIIILLLFSFQAESQTPMHWLRKSISCDADAQEFIDSSGITDATEKGAICTLVKQLKDSSLWSKLYAVYPMVGSSSTSCKWNLLDPRDADNAYRLTFNGGWTFSSAGAVSDNTAYAQTHLVPSTVMTEYDTHASGWVSESGAADRILGAFNGSQIFEILPRTGGDLLYARCYTTGGGPAAVSSTDASGLWTLSVTSSSDATIYRNGSSMNTTAPTSGLGSLSIELYLNGMNFSGSPDFRSAYTYIIFSIGEGLTPGEAATLYNIFNTFKTTLGR